MTHTQLVKLLVLLTLLWSVADAPSFAQTGRFDVKDRFKPITLNQVIQQGLSENHDQKAREMQDNILELQWAGVWDTFWVPTLTLSLETQAQRISRFRHGRSSAATPNTPTGVAALDFGEYTVFNWGKDYLDYLNNKQTIRRSKQVLTEEKRALKHQIIVAYFDVLTKKEIEISRRDQLRHASFLYRLNKEKVTAQKIARLEYQQARSEFLRCQDEYYNARSGLEQAQEELAFLIHDEPGTRYVYQETLEYRDSKVEFTEAEDMAKKNSPAVLNAKVTEEVAERHLEKARRENLPLPKFTVDFGAYTQTWGRSAYRQDYETSAGNSSIEMVATINATWTLYGDAGFFNRRDLEEASLTKGIATRNFLKANDYVSEQLHILFDKISNYQKQMSILEPRLKNARKTFDVAMDNYTKKKASFSDFLHALRDFTATEIDYANTKFQHLKAKVDLASMSGVEDFPGERFENLAAKTKTLDDILKDSEDLLQNDEQSKTGKTKKAPTKQLKTPEGGTEQGPENAIPTSEIQSDTPPETTNQNNNQDGMNDIPSPDATLPITPESTPAPEATEQTTPDNTGTTTPEGATPDTNTAPSTTPPADDAPTTDGGTTL